MAVKRRETRCAVAMCNEVDEQSIPCAQILQTICDNEQEYYYQQLIRDKIKGVNLPTPKSFGCMFVDLVNELKTLKEDLVAWKLGGPFTARPSFCAWGADGWRIFKAGLNVASVDLDVVKAT